MAEAALSKGAQTLENLVGGTFARKAAITVLGSVFLAVLSQIQVPSIPVPVTLQTLGVMLIGLTFGFRLATATVALYLIEGAIGLPVFAGFSSGFVVLFGGTAGYLFGFLVAAALMGFMADRGVTRSWLGMVATLLAGEVVIFGFGLAYLTYLYGFDNALAYGLYPFLLADIVKMAIATLIGKGVIKGASSLANL
jgi:biotin transport system substrate-specific component